MPDNALTQKQKELTMIPNVARLERLCVILEGVDRAHFHLRSWASPECGTTACAVGYAALDPMFRAEGLELSVQKNRFLRDDNIITAENLCDVSSSFLNRTCGAEPWFDGHRRWDAVRRFFGLDPIQASRLFAANKYNPSDRNNPAAVIVRIRELIDATPVTAPRVEPEVAAAMVHAG